MAKQKCGTCRFFQEAGLAGSGWCHHPQRKTPGVMIMVRRNELACRDEWSRTLWQSPSDQTDDEPAFQRPPLTAPQPPTSAENLQSLLGGQEPAALAPPNEDVLLSEARLISEARFVPEPEPPREPPARPVPTANFDPRTAIFRAREAYRDRARANAAARRLAGAEAMSGDHHLDEEPDAPGVRAGEMNAEPPPRYQVMQPEAAPAAERETDSGGGILEFAAQSDVLSVTPALPLTVAQPAIADQANGVTPVAREAPAAPGSAAAVRERRGVAAGSASLDVDAPATSSRAPVADPSRTDSDDEPNLPVWFRTDLPRICRACRDFRPATEGQRGWCANAWAFTHRRLVQGDDQAPCHSAIGDRWVPVDAVWLVAADVSAHGRATPLLDRLIADERAQRRRS